MVPLLPPTLSNRSSAFVCPFCGSMNGNDASRCLECGSNLVVPLDHRRVYRTVLPMCGPDCDQIATVDEGIDATGSLPGPLVGLSSMASSHLPKGIR